MWNPEFFFLHPSSELPSVLVMETENGEPDELWYKKGKKWEGEVGKKKIKVWQIFGYCWPFGQQGGKKAREKKNSSASGN